MFLVNSVKCCLSSQTLITLFLNLQNTLVTLLAIMVSLIGYVWRYIT